MPDSAPLVTRAVHETCSKLFIRNRTSQAGFLKYLLTALLQASDHELLGFCNDAGPVKHLSERAGASVLYRPDL